MRGKGLLCLAAMMTVSCTQLTNSIDEYNFCWFGGTVFSSPGQMLMKDIHLDTGHLAAHEVIVEGTVVNVGSYTTYLVLTDESARMLVVLTNLVDADKFLKRHKPKNLRVLGTVERGQKGLPFIQAKALSVAAADGEAS